MSRQKKSRPRSAPASAPAVVVPQEDLRWSRDPWFWGLSLLAAALLLLNLGGRCLWQDEAETGVLARSVLQHGKPLATDGVNVISQEAGKDYGPDLAWTWCPWLQFYIGAAGLKLFGDDAFALRLPFALMSCLVVPLVYVIGRRGLQSVTAARFAALALATSPWFLLQARQARWEGPSYFLACLVLLGVFEVRRSWAWPVVIAVAGATLFYTNYFMAISLLVAIAIASPLLERSLVYFLRLGTGLAGSALLSLPGVFFFHVLGRTNGGGSHFGTQLWTYIAQLATFLAPLPLLLLVAFDKRAGSRFLLALTLATCVMFSLAPWGNFRYLTLLFPVAALLTGIALAWVKERNAIVAWIVVAVLVFTPVLHRLPFGYLHVEGTKQVDAAGSPFLAVLSEIASPPVDATCAAAAYLRSNAKPGQSVLMTYGDLVLQFSTRMHVMGGMQGKPLPADPDWIVLRSFCLSDEPGKDCEVSNYIEQQIDPKKYRVFEKFPDPGEGGNPDPAFHWFRTPPDAHVLRVIGRR